MISIYGTFGPACADAEMMTEMFRKGMTGMRLNLSHTSLEESAETLAAFHTAAKAAGVVPELLIDMQGEKRKYSVEYVLRVFGPLTWGWFESLRKLLWGS